MSQPNDRPRGARQMSGPAANGGLAFYLLLALGLALTAGVLAAIRLLQVAG